jgi:hypothetical protein
VRAFAPQYGPVYPGVRKTILTPKFPDDVNYETRQFVLWLLVSKSYNANALIEEAVAEVQGDSCDDPETSDPVRDELAEMLDTVLFDALMTGRQGNELYPWPATLVQLNDNLLSSAFDHIDLRRAAEELLRLAPARAATESDAGTA